MFEDFTLRGSSGDPLDTVVGSKSLLSYHSHILPKVDEILILWKRLRQGLHNTFFGVVGFFLISL